MKPVFPHNYEVELLRSGPSIGEMRSEEAEPLRVGPPPQFQGGPDHWSPETLLLASISSCLLTTYESLAERKGLVVKEYNSRIVGELSKTKNGILFTEIKISGTIRSNDADLAQDLLNKAHKFCIISNMLNLKVDLDFTFEM